MVLFLWPLVLPLVLAGGAAQADVSGRQLVDKCKEKTPVMQRVDGKLTVVGERLDGYCEGYLLGVYGALVQSGIICAPSNEVTGDYLKSVFDHYFKTLPRDKAEGYLKTVSPASEMLKTAYSRAFPCKDNREHGIPPPHPWKKR